MAGSRTDKYKELRQGLKGEAGIDRTVVPQVEESDDKDDFLSFVNRNVDENVHEESIEDTLHEALTFEQMRNQSSKEIDKALHNAKVGVGKEEQYNTRMDILNKIREPENKKIKIDSMDQFNTEEFAKGMILNKEPEVKEEVPEKVVEEKAAKPKMSLLERLASMSPKEDAKKAQEVIEQQEKEENEKIIEELEEEFETPNKEPIEEVKEEPIEETVVENHEDDITPPSEEELEELFPKQVSLSEMLNSIKEKDAKEVKEVTGKDIEVKEPKTFVEEPETDEDEDDVEEKSKSMVVLDVIIVILVIVLFALIGVILYQNIL